MTEMLQADPGRRRLAGFAILLVLLAGGAALSYLMTELDAIGTLMAEAPELAHQRYLRLVRAVLGVLSLSSLGLGAFWLRQGWRGWRSGRLPPPGSRPLVDQPLVTGDRARRRALGLAALGIAAILLALATPWMVLPRLTAILDEARERASPIDWQLSPREPSEPGAAR